MPRVVVSPCRSQRRRMRRWPENHCPGKRAWKCLSSSRGRFLANLQILVSMNRKITLNARFLTWKSERDAYISLRGRRWLRIRRKILQRIILMWHFLACAAHRQWTRTRRSCCSTWKESISWACSVIRILRQRGRMKQIPQNEILVTKEYTVFFEQ